MIASFANKATAMVFAGRLPRGMSRELARAALVKLRQLDVVERLEELASPPGNHLEMLRGDRAGWLSIRINRQWRITFVWRGGEPHDVLIEDYH